MFALSNVRHVYDGTPVLEIADWRGEQGAKWLLLGPSGSGKTTALHILAGLLAPTAGTVVAGGEDLTALAASERDRFRGRTIGIVFQRLHLVAALTVAQNLALAAYSAGLKPDGARIGAILERLGVEAKAAARPSELSHGQAQRVALARALVNRPRLILADEPTSNLDDANADRVIDLLIHEAEREEATLVVATHDRRIRDRIPNRLELPA